MSDVSHLETIVDSILGVPERSKKLREEIRRLGFTYHVVSDDSFALERFNIRTFLLYYMDLEADIIPETPLYDLSDYAKGLLTCSAFYELYLSCQEVELEPSSKVKKLMKDLVDFYSISRRISYKLNDFKRLQDPGQFSSKEDYIKFFEQVVDLYADFARRYGNLKKKGYVYGEELEELGLFVKLNLPKLMGITYAYHEELEERIETFSDILNDKKLQEAVLERLNKEENEISEIIKMYEELKSKEPEFIKNLTNGLNIIVEDNRKIVRPLAGTMYKVLSYKSKLK